MYLDFLLSSLLSNRLGGRLELLEQFTPLLLEVIDRLLSLHLLQIILGISYASLRLLSASIFPLQTPYHIYQI